MLISRRHILAFTGSALFSRVFGSSTDLPRRQPIVDVDRLLAAGNSVGSQTEFRKYTVGSTVLLFSIPIVSRACVGSGYAVVEQAARTVSLQFGAGSYPESARGLNRLGYIQEAVVEGGPGRAEECAWFAFMTTSKEAGIEQAKKALEKSGPTIPYSASQGYGREGRFRSSVDRLEFSSGYAWRDLDRLVETARSTMNALQGAGSATGQAGSGTSATFLYLLRQAILDSRPQTSASLIFNGKQFRLETKKGSDPAATGHFIEKKLVEAGGSVTRIDAMITETATGNRTPFRVWFDTRAGRSLPLRFEYQAKSFLRLTFEADAEASVPPVRFAFRSSGDKA
jgi:hypothetical protein